jgi:hypothetical protein
VGQSLYDTDFIAWTEDQTRMLRKRGPGSNLGLDWEHLAEEIGSLGRSQADALASQLNQIILHLVKLHCSPTTEPRAGWRTSVGSARSTVARLLRNDLGLKSRLHDILVEERPDTLDQAVKSMLDFGEAAGAAAASRLADNFPSDAQVVGDWFPDVPVGTGEDE